MGGAAGSATNAYFLGTDNVLYLSTNNLPTPEWHMPWAVDTLASGHDAYDIAREGVDNLATGDVWVATGPTGPSLRAYNAQGQRVDSLDLLPSVRGLAFSTSGGNRYLWASCPADNMIHQIQLWSTGTSGSSQEQVTECILSVSSNPFVDAVTLTGSGFGSGAVVSIYDLLGRQLISGSFQGSFTWDGQSAGSGVYMARVVSVGGREAWLRLVKL